MRRISNDMPVSDMQFFLRRQEEALSNVQGKIGTQSKLFNLRDDPIGAAHAVRYESFLTRLERFEKNTQFAMEHFDNTFDYLNEANSVLQRIRELALTGAHGTYSPDDLKIMAVEVNELLKELVSISNVLGPDTKQAFAGDKVFTEPFRIVDGRVDGGQETMIVRVEYRGSGATRKAEIGDGMFVDLDLGGDVAFWAERMSVFSSVDATNYRVQEATSFFIDGVEIFAEVGDTLPTLVAKINDSSAPVKASIDPGTRGLMLEGTNAHLIRAEDRAGGPAILRDLGIINGNMVNNAPNWNSSALVSGGSVFDMVIRLRDAMIRGDSEFIGSQGLIGIDHSLNNINIKSAEVGSRMERAEFAWHRINAEIPNIQSMLQRDAGLNMETAAMELKMAQFAHQATLQTAAKILPPTLLDFLR
jgi:flagellar hook-associated protein 3 FlgL